MKKLITTAGLVLAVSLAGSAIAHPAHSGYATDSSDSIVRTGSGGCWRASSWSEASLKDAVDGCLGYQKPMPVAKPTPAPVVVPKPKPAPVFVDRPVQETHIVYFDFNSSEVGSVAEITAYLSSLDSLDSISLVGHADRLGANAYNLKLSERRMQAVADKLTAAGVDSSKIITGFQGEDLPVQACEGRGTALKQCLAKNRRVEVVINGSRRVQQ